MSHSASQATPPFGPIGNPTDASDAATKRYVDANGGSQPDGSVVPVADPAGVALDTTTYDNTLSGVGKLTTLVFPTGATCAVAIAVEGDDWPRWVFQPDPGQAVYMGDGTVNPVNLGPASWIEGPDQNGHYALVFEAGEGFTQFIRHGSLDANAGYRTEFSGGIAVNGIGGTGISSGSGAPTIGGNVGDCYIRRDGGDGSWIYRCTVAGVAGAATWVAKL